MTRLNALRERLRAEVGRVVARPDDLDGWTADLFGASAGAAERMLLERALGGSIAAALALVRKRFPTSSWMLWNRQIVETEPPYACVICFDRAGVRLAGEGDAPADFLAVLIALTGAVIALDPNKGNSSS